MIQIWRLILASIALGFLLSSHVSVADEAPGDRARRPVSSGDIQQAAQRLETARHFEKADGDPLKLLAAALRSTRSALSDVASPRGEREVVEAATALALSAAELRLRCNAIPGVGERARPLARFAGELTSGCARLLTAVDEVVALPDPRARSERAVALLSELAAAGPASLDPARAPHEPTIRRTE